MKGTVSLKAATLPLPHLSPRQDSGCGLHIRTTHSSSSSCRSELPSTTPPFEPSPVSRRRVTPRRSNFFKHFSNPTSPPLLCSKLHQFVGLTEEDSLSASWNGRDGIETAEVNCLSAAEKFCPEVETEWPE